MSLAKWDPFETFEEMRDDIDRLFSRKVSPWKQAMNKGELAPKFQGSWLPAVDIHEDKEAFYFDVEAPGMIADAFDINVANSVLTVKGERKYENEKKEKNYHRVEREYGTFTRTFMLPESAETNAVTARYEHGVLKIKIGKKPTATPKRITVQ